MHLLNVFVLDCLESALFPTKTNFSPIPVRGNPFCIFLLMEELVNFFVQTAGRKSPEIINKMMCAAEPNCTKKSPIFRNSPTWSCPCSIPCYIPLLRFGFRFVLYCILLYCITLYFTPQWNIYRLF